ncbi:MAG TPA: hypothetical protein VHZ97_29450 [Pseudonocardiaceae bacterium]|jgi:hypothetical protein|nr:hypothetical protein [Pseudonocardiaceae bacterium]
MSAAVGAAALLVGALPAVADGTSGAKPSATQAIADWVLLHSTRNTNGTWTSWDEPSGTAFTVSSAGMADNSTQFALVGVNDLVYDLVRAPNGTSYTYQLVPGPGWSGGFAAGDVTVAKGPNGSAEVFVTDYNSNLLYENDRSAAGSWSGWKLLPGLSGASSFQVRHVAAAGLPNGSVQLLVTTPDPDGYIYSNTHNADGSWTGWQALAGIGSASKIGASSVAIAGLPDGSAQLVAMVGTSGIYHEVRGADGTYHGWQLLAGANGASSFNAWHVAIAGMPDGSAQLVATDNANNIYHEIRAANGNWSGWQALAGVGGAANLTAADVTIAGLPDGTAQVFAANK